MNFDQEYYGNALTSWLLASVVAIAILAALRLIKAVVLRRVEKLAERTPTRLDDTLVETLNETRWWFYLTVASWGFLEFVVLPDDAERIVHTVATMLLLLQVALWAQSFVQHASDAWVAHASEDGTPRRKTAAAAARFVVRLATWSVVVVLALDNLGVEISGLVAGLGIGGVAAALAVQNVLGDLFSSLSIYFDRPFDLGDFIIVGDELGTVERIGWRSTRLVSLGGEQIIFANSDLAQSRIRNYRRMSERRMVSELGVTYQTPHAALKQIPAMLKEAVEAQEGVRFDRAHFKGFGDWALEFEFVWYVLSGDYNLMMDKQQAILLFIHERLETMGVEVAFPSQTLYVDKVNFEGSLPRAANDEEGGSTKHP